MYLLCITDSSSKGGKKGKAGGEGENVDWGARMADMKRYVRTPHYFYLFFS
jgi:hypothetical protein